MSTEPRRALRILDPKTNLTAVAIEGISPLEGPSARASDDLLVVDTAEYYGGETLETASQVNYVQLKHSTTRPEQPWTASGIADTITAFAKLFNGRSQRLNRALVSKLHFQFVTNRPVHPHIEAGLEIGRQNRSLKGAPRAVVSAYRALHKASGLSARNFLEFTRRLELLGSQETRSLQSQALNQGLARYLPHLNSDVNVRLKELVRSKTLSDAKHDPVIRRETILHALGVTDPKRLLPSPASFDPISDAIPREQEPDIARAVVCSSTPIVIHAHGGVGKSVLARRLPQKMPTGSVSVVFDGFSGGAYRTPRDPRHRHDRGMVQIVNELAFQGLCDPLLPTSAPDSDYLEAFRSRLDQASAEVRRTHPDALVMIVLDAADNSEMAASDDHRRSFARDLLQENPPTGCRIVALARTERLDLLHLPATTLSIALRPFSSTETARFLRVHYADASDDRATEFHRLTAGSPRVQANAIAAATTLEGVLRGLGPSVRTVDEAIASQLDSALGNIREHAASKHDIDTLCAALAILPPLVPIRTLAHAANVPEAAARSFVSDMGRPLLEIDGAVQFRDEPVETWFRKKFSSDATLCGRLADALASLVH